MQRKKQRPEIISFGKTELTLEQFIWPKNDWIKPIGGIWGSTYRRECEQASDWERWCQAENFEYNREEAVIFTLREDARVYEIDSLEDLRKLAMRYNTNGNNYPVYLDFEQIMWSGKWDAIHLTEKGQAETRFSQPYSLYGWDVECYLILNFHAIDKQRAARRN